MVNSASKPYRHIAIPYVLRDSLLPRRHNDRASRAPRSRALPPVNARPVSVASNTPDGIIEAFDTGQSNLGASSQPHSASDQYRRPPLDQSGYIGEQSLMSFSSSAPTHAMINTGSFPEHIHNEILRATDATSLPPASRVKVFADAYFQHLYHVAPVIDRTDLVSERTSIILQQAICLIGSQLRYPRDLSPTLLSESYYLKIKTLIYTNHEPDNFALLKTLCILCFWIVTPPVVVSLDSSYHWLGVAVRLACQMGLHRESSYSKLSNAGVARRIIWFLFVSPAPCAVCYYIVILCLGRRQAASSGFWTPRLPAIPEHGRFSLAD